MSEPRPGNTPAGEPTPPPGQAVAERVQIERIVYGGLGLGRTENGAGAGLLVPLTLAGEVVEVATASHASKGSEAEMQRLLEPSPERVVPGCPHFGVCGGCHLQMASYAEQLRLKREVLQDSLQRAGLIDAPEPQVHAGEPWGYRNRIRLRLELADGALRFGYTRRLGKQQFLPIVTCPISAPILWRAAETMLVLAKENKDIATWLGAAREVELFTNGGLSRLQITLLCPAVPRLAAKQRAPSFERAFSAVQTALPELAGAGAVQAQWQPLRLRRALAEWGAPGLSYIVGDEHYWVARGGFFQVNRFLLPKLLELVCHGRCGKLAWDLFAGVGLFSRVLARGFDQVIAVEAHPGSATELRRALERLNSEARPGSQPGRVHRAEESTTLAFLQHAMLQRERPDLIVLDPPRAGAGVEVCELLLRVAAPQMVYVSCDPVTLGRDLAVLQREYLITALHLVDLFPQTYHQEAVVTLRRR